MTAETENRLRVVALPSGRVVRRIALPRDPEDVAANGGECSTVVVVSAAGRAVTVLDGETLNPRRVLRGFAAPHIPEIAPGGQYGYVTDDARGTVTAIYLGDARVTSTIEVGAGAHHLSFDASHQRAWVALGESGRTIEQVDAPTGRILHRARTPYGSFELAADDRYVVVSSLLRGTLAVYTPQLKPLRVAHLAPATREVALSSPNETPP